MTVSSIKQQIVPPNEYLRGTHWNALKQDQDQSAKKIMDLYKNVEKLTREVQSLNRQQPMSPGQVELQYAFLTDGVNQAFVPVNDYGNQIFDLYQREGFNREDIHARITQVDRKHEAARRFLKQAHEKELALLKKKDEVNAAAISLLESRITRLEARKIPAEEDNMVYYRLDELERRLSNTEFAFWSDFASKISHPPSPR